MKISLLMTGSELMSGDIVDSNSAKLAAWLSDEGLSVHYKVTIGDDLALLVSEIDRLSRDSDVLIVNGGLGPTQDDLTAEALASVIAQPLIENAEALAHLEYWCKARNYELSPENRKQAILPEGVTILPNSVGSAVGFSVEHQACKIFCTPGVPFELESMFFNAILPALPQADRVTRLRRRYHVFGYGESALQRLLMTQFPDWPDALELGFRASIPLVELKIAVANQTNQALLDEWGQKIERLLGDHIVSTDNKTLAESLVGLLADKQWKVTTAESCTGGKIASLITEVSGASSVFEASVVSYSNEIKQRVLQVPAANLEQDGAVSESVVRAMLAGALKLSAADVGVAVSGIAGPSGGSADKPVGTVWIAWGMADAIQARCFYVPGNRIFFQKMVSAIALDLVRRVAMGSEQTPAYFESRRQRQADEK